MKEPSLPGITSSSPEFCELLRRSAQTKHIDTYAKHKNADGSACFVNRLVLETSPYLLQHAFNPINWHPWGEEAFLKAKSSHRPVLLSIGYSTCHWCHVMEEESFEDLEIAALINKNYIAIKVDREERPDLDAVYMAAVLALTGRGGWPMTVFLTPERKPFYGGTYFPARDGDRGVSFGFLTLLTKISDAYTHQSHQVLLSADELSQEVQNHLGALPSQQRVKLDHTVLDKAALFFESIFDAHNGGVKGAPKFPSTFPLRFLLQRAQQTGDVKALRMTTSTLKKMAQGGIYDQVGGGFHRYSTDAGWLVPHFEKMLYDNALLVTAYVEAYQITHDEEFAGVIKETLAFIERDMTSADGAFYAALDADSETPSGHKDEGYFYTWSLDEIEKALGNDQAALFADIFQVGRGAELEGRSILHRTKSIASDLIDALEKSKNLLELERRKRKAPHRDEKILTSSNALMISALAKAGFALKEQNYIDRALKAAHFLINKLYINNELKHSYSENTASAFGFLDDYAFFCAACLDLFEVTHNSAWLSLALTLTQTLDNQFADDNYGAYFMTSIHHEKLLAREKPQRDGAQPSGNSVAILNLMRLYDLRLDTAYKKQADKALEAFSYLLSNEFYSVSELLLALDYKLDKAKVCVIITPKNNRKAAEGFTKIFREHLVPHHALIVVEEGEAVKALSSIIPYVDHKPCKNNQATAYLCEQGSCQLPTNDPAELARQLKISSE